jgi:hypothetical protein
MSAQHTPGPRQYSADHNENLAFATGYNEAMKQARKALAPFVRAANLFDGNLPTDQVSLRFEDGTVLTVADLRAARAAIGKATGSAS